MPWGGSRELVTLLVPDKAQHLHGKVAQLPHRARCRRKDPAERGLGSRVICQVCGPWSRIKLGVSAGSAAHPLWGHGMRCDLCTLGVSSKEGLSKDMML